MICQLLFLLLQMKDILLYGALCDQLIYRHHVSLSDPVGSVRGLVLYCQIPPGIIVDDDIRRRQV